MMLNAKKLNSQINEFRFLLRGSNFIENSKMKFASKKEARSFLIRFLLVECLAGTNYSNQELMVTYKKLQKLVKRNQVISSEQLPIHKMKSHADKELQHVHYQLQGKVCTYKKDCS